MLQALLYHFFRGLSALLCRLPRKAALGLGVAFACCVYAFYRATPYREFIQNNLAVAFPEAPRATLNATARAHLVQLAKCIVELLRFPLLTRWNIASEVRLEGLENLQAARDAGNGLIVATAHFGNWELLGAALALHDVPLHVLVQRPSQDAFERLFREFRERVGVTTSFNHGPASLRPGFRALARNEALGLVADQHGESQEAIVSFFAQPVSAPLGPIVFARRTGAAVLPMFCFRQDDDTHVLVIEPALSLSGDDEADAQALYARYEVAIRQRPDHWLWVHDRWARRSELVRGPGERQEVFA